MPKVPKQRTETPREPTEDTVQDDSGDASSGAIASSEALLKQFSEMIAAQATRAQIAMDQSLARLDSSLDAKIDNVIRRIDAVAASCDSIVARQTEAEDRISALEDTVTPLKAKVDELAKTNADLLVKVLDLESRSRRDNIRLLNLRESTEGADPIAFFEKFIPTLLQMPVPVIAIDRAHRGFGSPPDGRPRPVFIKLHRSRDVTAVLSAAKRMGKLQHEDRLIRIVPDIPPSVRLARRAFNAVCDDLIKRNVRFRMAFPAVLSFEMNGSKKSFKDPKDARVFLESSVTHSDGEE
ncbi:hypothetical protein WMY93_018128 [Mugilogobius chulae]|uniref:L1 transposable element RRM domain-containing protein n=1 Tax=Mugilogobius chulae TaxID=88201 RepID=A0AAW0NV88_9GOBI